MAVGASKPTVVADADGFFGVKNKMLVSSLSIMSPDSIMMNSITWTIAGPEI